MSVKLTQYSKASGCGCKIAPAVLEEILTSSKSSQDFRGLLVGNQSNDDAAVMELNDEDCVISTTDFFTPIVDDPFDFGKISSANALSDVYAMGGKPIMAIAILGWPIDKLSPKHAAEVIEGAKEICHKAGVPIAGGHSIDISEPVFGLAVTGMVKKINIKRNNTVKNGDVLYMTKPLGTGIMSSALKRGLLQQEDYTLLIKNSTALNSIGEILGQKSFVNAMTDITGFGFAGHLLEMLNGTDLSATVIRSSIPIMPAAEALAKQFVFPDNTTRNYNAQSAFIEGFKDLDMLYYCDPQTSGGLLISVDPNFETEFIQLMQIENQFSVKVGNIESKKEKKIIFN